MGIYVLLNVFFFFSFFFPFFPFFLHRGLFFGDYMIPEAEVRIYDEVSDMKDLTPVIEKCVIETFCSFMLLLRLCMLFTTCNHL